MNPIPVVVKILAIVCAVGLLMLGLGQIGHLVEERQMRSREAEQNIAQETLDLKYGIVTINELRGERGLPPVEWGDRPWLPLLWAPTDLPERASYAPAGGRPKVGRRKKPKKDG